MTLAGCTSSISRQWEVQSCDLFAWLKAMPLYPRIYWASPERDTVVAAAGSVAPLASSRLFGWRSFCSKLGSEWEDFAPSALFLPRFELSLSQGRVFFREHGEGDSGLATRQAALQKPRFVVRESSSSPKLPQWRHNIERALEEIRQRRLQKVVLARKVELECQGAIDPIALCKAFDAPQRAVYLFQPTPESAFLGASPERLYRRRGRRIECDALAGTCPRGEESALLASKKDLHEFLVVKERLLETLAPLCTSPPAASKIALRQTHTLSHLHAQIRGHLKEGVTDEEILDALHPTAAVGGWPKKTALDFLTQAEPFARGLYAAPIGWKSPEEAEFAVAIRCCLVQRSKATLFAGTGIVEGSDPLLEWEESEQKLSQWKTCFV